MTRPDSVITLAHVAMPLPPGRDLVSSNGLPKEQWLVDVTRDTRPTTEPAEPAQSPTTHRSNVDDQQR